MSSVRTWGWRLFQLAVLVAVGYFIYRTLVPELSRISVSDLERYRPAALPLLLSIVLLLAMYLLHAFLWREISVKLGGQQLSARDTMRIYFVSGLGRYLPLKFWQMAGMALLSQRAGLSPVIATAASLIGQLGFLTAGSVFLALLLPASYGGVAILAALACLLVGFILFSFSATARGRSFRQRALSRFGPRVAEAGALLDRVTGRYAAQWFLGYAVSWILLGAAFAIFAISFDSSFATHARHFAGTVAISYLIGLISLLPGGIGMREMSMLVALELVIPAPAALLIAATSRLWFTFGEIAPIGLIPLLSQSAPGASTV